MDGRNSDRGGCVAPRARVSETRREQSVKMMPTMIRKGSSVELSGRGVSGRRGTGWNR